MAVSSVVCCIEDCHWCVWAYFKIRSSFVVYESHYSLQDLCEIIPFINVHPPKDCSQSVEALDVRLGAVNPLSSVLGGEDAVIQDLCEIIPFINVHPPNDCSQSVETLGVRLGAVPISSVLGGEYAVTALKTSVKSKFRSG